MAIEIKVEETESSVTVITSMRERRQIGAEFKGKKDILSVRKHPHFLLHDLELEHIDELFGFESL